MSQPALIAAESAFLASLNLGNTYASAQIAVLGGNGVPLAIFSMGYPAFPPPDDVMTDANAIQQSVAATNGTPAAWALMDRGGAIKLSGSIGLQGSGADFEVAAVQPVTVGQALQLESVAYTQETTESGVLTGFLALLPAATVSISEAPRVTTMEWNDLCRMAAGPVEWGNRNWHLEYEFGLSARFHRNGYYQ